MILPILGLFLGIIIGFIVPMDLPTSYSSYMSVALLAALDSVFGGYRAELEGHFEVGIFISGFFGNTLIAAILAYLGDRLGIPLYYAAIFTFGTRLFQNFAIIRRIVIQNFQNKKKNIKKI